MKELYRSEPEAGLSQADALGLANPASSGLELADFVQQRCPKPKDFTLSVEEAVARIRVRQDAGIGAAENAVAVARDDAVSPVANGSGQRTQEVSEKGPDAADPLQ